MKQESKKLVRNGGSGYDKRLSQINSRYRQISGTIKNTNERKADMPCTFIKRFGVFGRIGEIRLGATIQNIIAPST